METSFWLAKVKLTQGPAKQEKETLLDYEIRKKIEIDKTWLSNFFQDDTVYGLELTSIGNKIVWEFFVNTKSEEQAIIKGNILLKSLKMKFPGLSGTYKVIPITTEYFFNQNLLLYELVLPSQITNTVRFSVIKQFIQNSRDNPNKNRILRLFILWQEDDSVSNSNMSPYGFSEFGDFKIKIFVKIDFKTLPFKNKKSVEPLLQAELDFLVMNVLNLKREGANIKEVSSNILKRILLGKVFWVNNKRIRTGIRYSKIIHEIPLMIQPSFIKPYNGDFNFPKQSGLPRPFILEDEKIIDLDISENDNNFIWFGKILRQGVPTEDNAYFHINNLSQSCIIAGETGTGKTNCASIIVNEIRRKAPHIGILTIGLSKKNQDFFFSPDKIIRYGDNDLKIPYFVKPISKVRTLEKYAQETAMYLTAAIGLKGTATTCTYNTMMAYGGAKNCPKTPTELFESTLNYLDHPDHKYHEKFQTNIKSEILNNVSQRFNDPIIEKHLTLTPEIPSWFNQWQNGMNIYLDLTEASFWSKIIVCFALFQMIKTLTSDFNGHTLNNLIVIDEVKHLAEKSLSTYPYDDIRIAKERLEIIMKELLEEFRSRGVAFLLIDTDPSTLFKSISKSPSLKLVFRLDLESGKCFTPDQKELKYIKNQEHRHAVFFNGTTGEEFIIKTLKNRNS